MKIFGKNNTDEKCKFLTLHCPDVIYIAIKDIAMMRWYERELVTRLCTQSGRCWIVQETPEEILAMISEVEK